MNDTLIASRKHATLALLIVAAVTLLGIQQASSLEAVRPEVSRVIPYLRNLTRLPGICADGDHRIVRARTGHPDMVAREYPSRRVGSCRDRYPRRIDAILAIRH